MKPGNQNSGKIDPNTSNLKITTEVCKEKIIKMVKEHNLGLDDTTLWKRVKKYKNGMGEVCRDFIYNNDTGIKATFVEKVGGGAITIDNKGKIYLSEVVEEIDYTICNLTAKEIENRYSIGGSDMHGPNFYKRYTGAADFFKKEYPEEDLFLRSRGGRAKMIWEDQWNNIVLKVK